MISDAKKLSISIAIFKCRNRFFPQKNAKNLQSRGLKRAAMQDQSRNLTPSTAASLLLTFSSSSRLFTVTGAEYAR